jgi:hypothetical protein
MPLLPICALVACSRAIFTFTFYHLHKSRTEYAIPARMHVVFFLVVVLTCLLQVVAIDINNGTHRVFINKIHGTQYVLKNQCFFSLTRNSLHFVET